MAFTHEDFLLSTDTARVLYHESAEHMPIIDYHCHLDPQQIAENRSFDDITKLWIVENGHGDHYKWRAMRANGVPEEYITGTGHSAWEIFKKWAETVPYTMRNPLYHWSHLELSRVFGIDRIIKPENAREIFEECNAKLKTAEFSTQGLIRKFNVDTLCTTDDPADDLRWHKQIAENPFGTKVLPAWRPDRAMAIENPEAFVAYVEKLAEAAGMDIINFTDFIDALQKRHDFFESMGCKLSDHGMDTFYSEDYTLDEIEEIFCDTMAGFSPTPDELLKFRSAMMYEFARMDAESGWVQQFHVGPIRNNNSKMFAAVGADTGYDSINDLPIAVAGNRFFDRLESEGKLAKTILYCLNPKDYEVMATMAYNFNDGSVAGKMQLGAAWWFLDQENGMRKQIDVLSSLGLLSRFVGMLTDSRSFISYPRHEYFRRILCDVLGNDVETGRIPREEMEMVHKMVRGISYENASSYFDF